MNKYLILKKMSVGLRILIISFMLFMFLAHIFFPDGPPPTFQEAILMIFFPTGLLIGFAMSWKYPTKGSIVAIISMILFYIGLFIQNGEFPRGVIFPIFLLPAILELVYQKCLRDCFRN